MKSIAELSVDSRLLFQALEKVEPGETITYAELSKVIGRDVTNGARGYLNTAVKKMLANNVVFGAVMRVGLKRLRDSEIAGEGDKFIERTHRASSRTIRKLGCVSNFESLSKEQKTTLNFVRSMSGVINHVTKTSQIKKVEMKTREVENELAIVKTLELFK